MVTAEGVESLAKQEKHTISPVPLSSLISLSGSQMFSDMIWRQLALVVVPKAPRAQAGMMESSVTTFLSDRTRRKLHLSTGFKINATGYFLNLDICLVVKWLTVPPPKFSCTACTLKMGSYNHKNWLGVNANLITLHFLEKGRVGRLNLSVISGNM